MLHRLVFQQLSKIQINGVSTLQGEVKIARIGPTVDFKKHPHIGVSARQSSILYQQ